MARCIQARQGWCSKYSSNVCVHFGVGAGLAGWLLLRRAGGDDERLKVGCLAWQQRAPGLRAAQG